MDFPQYRGTEHPEVWVNQVQTKCLLKGIRNDKDVLKACKLNISTSIVPTGEINTTADLIKALKAHPTFSIYKNDCKEKLETMVFDGGDTAQFLATFRGHCFKAEISKPDEIRNRLLRTYPSNDFFKNEFSRRTAGVTDANEIYEIFSNVNADDSKAIKFDPDYLIFIKHAKTGRYLSSVNKNYTSGSQRQLVFSGKKVQSDESWWYLKCEVPFSDKEPFQKDRVFYDDIVYLTHKKTKFTLNVSEFYKPTVSPSGAEVHCFEFAFANFRFVKTDQTNLNNKTPYVRSRDTVYLKLEDDHILCSRDGAEFTIENNSYQEVFGHREKVSKDDEWIIEIR